MKSIWFDMDGTLADFYSVDGWLDCLIKGKTKPYREAKPLVNMRQLGREIKRLQELGYTVGIISWLSKSGTDEYNERVTTTKIKWLQRHLGSVNFNKVHIVKYGTPKQTLGQGILFDDEERNRMNWIGTAYNVDNIINTLRAIV